MAKKSEITEALAEAASEGAVVKVEKLLAKGACMEGKYDGDWTALMWAASGGHTETVALLIDKGANIEAKSIDSWNALMRAANEGHTETVELLLDRGANIDAKDDEGQTALNIAADKGHIETVKLLLEKGADHSKFDFSIMNFKRESQKSADDNQAQIESLGPKPCVKNIEFLRNYPKVWNEDNWEDYVENIDGKYHFSIPFDLDPSHLEIDYEHGECPPELQPFVTGSFFLDNIELFTEPFEAEFYTFYDATELYFYKWDGKKLSRAVIDYSSRFEEIMMTSSTVNEDKEGREFDILNSMIEGRYIDQRFRPLIDDWRVIYEKTEKGKQAIEASEKEELKEKAEAYYDQGQLNQYENAREAIKWYRKAANLGHAESQFELAMMCRGGYDIPVDYEEAAKWYLKAANQGHAYAQYHLGILYETGEGVAENFEEAIKWYFKAANQNVEGAQYAIGVCYSSGHAVPQDYEEAVKWYRKAADKGYYSALLTLGDMCETGTGMPVDYEKAMQYYRQALEDAGPEESVVRKKIKSLEKRIKKSTDGAVKSPDTGSKYDKSALDEIKTEIPGGRPADSDFAEFKKAQGKDLKKRPFLPIAEMVHEILVSTLHENGLPFEIRFGDGTFSLSVPKHMAKSRTRTFARFGLLGLKGGSYLESLYKNDGDPLPQGATYWKRGNFAQYLFRFDSVEAVKDLAKSIKGAILSSYKCLSSASF